MVRLFRGYFYLLANMKEQIQTVEVVRKLLDAANQSHINTALKLAEVQVLLDNANQRLGQMQYLEQENLRLNTMLQQIRQTCIIKFGYDPLIRG